MLDYWISFLDLFSDVSLDLYLRTRKLQIIKAGFTNAKSPNNKPYLRMKIRQIICMYIRPILRPILRPIASRFMRTFIRIRKSLILNSLRYHDLQKLIQI
jgi:hypothetical protein